MLSAGVALFASAAFAADSYDNNHWTPNEKDVAKVDAGLGTIKNFGGFDCKPQDIAGFARHYWGDIDSRGHRYIKVQLVSTEYPNQLAGVHIESRWYPIADGGCGVATVSFDAETLRFLEGHWGGR